MYVLWHKTKTGEMRPWVIGRSKLMLLGHLLFPRWVSEAYDPEDVQRLKKETPFVSRPR